MAASSQTFKDLLKNLECPVCHEVVHSPKVLPCGHTLCREPCLESLTRKGSVIRCPDCRANHKVPQGGAARFATNAMVAKILEHKEEPVRRMSTHRCPECSATSELMTCLHCGTDVCEKCVSTHW